jgi:hypothetical protein
MRYQESGKAGERDPDLRPRTRRAIMEQPAQRIAERPEKGTFSGFLDRIGEAEVVEVEAEGVTVDVEAALRGDRAYALRLQRHGQSCEVTARVLWSRLDRTRRNEMGEVAAVYRVRLTVERPEALAAILSH